MPKSKPRFRRRPPLLNVLLLLCAATVTLATLKADSDGSSGSSSDDHEWLGEDRQRLLVQIAPVADRLDGFGYSGALFLGVQIDHIPESKAELPHWSLSMVTSDGELFALDGTFDAFGGEIQIEDNGTKNGDLSSVMGRLCESGETADDDCIPCSTDAGCFLHVEVDLCYSVGDRHTRAGVAITRDTGEAFELECAEEADSSPCRSLNEWLNLKGEPSEAGLCPGDG